MREEKKNVTQKEKVSGLFHIDPKGNSRRMFETQSPVYSSGLPNKNFPSYLDQMKRFNLPVNPEDNTKYQSAYDRMKNTNFSYR